MIERDIDIGISCQCELLGIHRSGLYYAPLPESEDNLHYMRLLDEQYLKTPFYGIRRITRWLNKKWFKVNRKRVKRLMGLMGWQTLYRKPNTSWKNKENKIYPYLLKSVTLF
jgi:putative transposase